MNRADRRRQKKLAKKKRHADDPQPLPPSLQSAFETAVDYHNSGNLDAAQAIYRDILTKSPDHPAALQLLGVCLHMRGDNEQAAEHIERAVALSPDFADGHFNLGNVYQALGRLDAAIESYQRVITLQPGNADALNNMAVTYERAAKLTDAEIYLRKAIEAQPEHADAHKNLGLLLGRTGRPADELRHIYRSSQLAPNRPDICFSLGESIEKTGDLSNAKNHYERAITIDPTFYQAHGRLAIIYEKLQQLDPAERHAKAAFDAAPGDPTNAYALAVLRRRQGDLDSALAVLRPFETISGQSPMAASIRFELGTLHDRSGEVDQAFAHFTTSNRLQAAGTTANKDAFLAKLQSLEAEFTPDRVAAWPPSPPTEPAGSPVFLVGFPRSGTTLLDQILDAHPAVQVMEEKPVLAQVIKALGGHYPQGLARLTGDQISDLRNIYQTAAARYIERRPDSLLIDKMPLNIVDIPLIARLYPDARIIFALRHPCDVVLSNFMQLFTLNDAMANFLTLPDAARCYGHVMGLWNRYEAVFNLPVHTVKYEDLIGDIQAQARALLNFLELPWNEAVLRPADHAKSRGRINTPSYQSVTEPIYQRAKYRWQRYAEHMAPVQDILQPYVERFGYSP